MGLGFWVSRVLPRLSFLLYLLLWISLFQSLFFGSVLHCFSY